MSSSPNPFTWLATMRLIPQSAQFFRTIQCLVLQTVLSATKSIHLVPLPPQPPCLFKYWVENDASGGDEEKFKRAMQARR
jgi:hypothetical protein